MSKHFDTVAAKRETCEAVLDYTLALTIAACLLMGLLAYFDVLIK